MTTSRQVSSPITNTAANFQAWATGVSNGLQAAGLVKTTDTGQINLGTVALPGAGVSAGYEIYRFNDTLQASYPIFIKIEYGQGDVAGDNAVWYQVGTATDGAGNINTNPSSRVRLSNGSQSSGNKYTSYFSGDGSYINFLLWPSLMPQGRYGTFLSIERTRDATGAGTAAGCSISSGFGTYNPGSGTYSQSYYQQSFSSVQNLWSENRGNIGVPFPPRLNTTYPSGSDGTTMSVFPLLIGTPVLQPPQIGLVGYYTPDISPLEVVSLTISGAAHSYLSTNFQDFGYPTGQGTQQSLALRFE